MMLAEAEKSSAAARIALAKAQAAEFARNHARPLWRMAIIASEIAPVGMVVPVIVAALLSQRRTRPLPG